MVDSSWVDEIRNRYWAERERILRGALEEATGKSWQEIDPARLSSIRHCFSGEEHFFIDDLLFLKIKVES